MSDSSGGTLHVSPRADTREVQDDGDHCANNPSVCAVSLDDLQVQGAGQVQELYGERRRQEFKAMRADVCEQEWKNSLDQGASGRQAERQISHGKDAQDGELAQESPQCTTDAPGQRYSRHQIQDQADLYERVYQAFFRAVPIGMQDRLSYSDDASSWITPAQPRRSGVIFQTTIEWVEQSTADHNGALQAHEARDPVEKQACKALNGRNNDVFVEERATPRPLDREVVTNICVAHGHISSDIATRTHAAPRLLSDKDEHLTYKMQGIHLGSEGRKVMVHGQLFDRADVRDGGVEDKTDPLKPRNIKEEGRTQSGAEHRQFHKGQGPMQRNECDVERLKKEYNSAKIDDIPNDDAAEMDNVGGRLVGGEERADKLGGQLGDFTTAPEELRDLLESCAT